MSIDRSVGRLVGWLIFWLVGWMVGWSVCHDFLRGKKLHFHAPIGAHFYHIEQKVCRQSQRFTLQSDN